MVKIVYFKVEISHMGSPVYLVVADFSTSVLWPLTIELTVILLVIMVWFHSWGMDAILGNRYGI